MSFQSVTQVARKKKIRVLSIGVEPVPFVLPQSYRRLVGVQATKLGQSLGSVTNSYILLGLECRYLPMCNNINLTVH